MSDYLDPNSEELLKDFFEEADQQVNLLEQNILAIEDDPNDKESIDEIFRAAHTLKGGSATVQMSELADFTHHIEDLLDEIRSGKVSINADIIDALLRSIDTIKLMMDSRKDGNIYDADISILEKELKSFLDKKEKTPAPSLKVSPQKVVAVLSNLEEIKQPSTEQNDDCLSESDIEELKEAANGEAVYCVRVSFDENNPMNTVGGIQVFARLKNIGNILRTCPEFDLLYEDNFFPVVSYFISTTKDSDGIKYAGHVPEVTLGIKIIPIDQILESKSELMNGDLTPENESDNKDTPDLPNERIQTVSATTGTGVVKKAKPKNSDRGGSVLRVDSKRIDNLLNLVSEAVINKGSFNQISTEFTELMTEFATAETIQKNQIKGLIDALPDFVEKNITENQTGKELRDIINKDYGNVLNTFGSFENKLKSVVEQFKSTATNLGRNTGDLHEAILRIRMVPISQLFSRFPRLVRDLSRSLTKKIDLQIEGEDTELDKSVIEELLDPLMHCVRNSLDHGIETPAERLKAGKSETGRLLLKANNEGNMIIIEVEDDGRGIDIQKVREKAVEAGIILPGKNLSDIEAHNLIFEPGFSTAKKVTNVSGRGVGLDVVKKQIEKLNGSVTVWSKLGEGSRFTIKLPLTLAIIQGLLIRVGKEVYAIPITSVIESLRVQSSDIKIIDNYEVIDVREDVISLLRLNQLFNIEVEQNKEHDFVVIVGSGDKKMGLMVDSLIGEEDVVIKPLKDKYANTPGIAGATIRGDGAVSLIIDVSQLLDLGVRKEQQFRSLM